MKDVLDSIKWPAALVITAAMALLGFMFWRGATLEALGTFLILLLGYQTQQRTQDSQRLGTIEQQTNGVNHGLQQQLADANARAAAIQKEAQDQILQLQREAAERHAIDMRIMAQMAAQLPMGSPLPPALTTDPVTPVSAPPALAMANGVPQQRNDEPTLPLP